MRKLTAIFILVLIAGAAGYLFFSQKPKDCSEQAFRGSRAYGQMPRRYHEITPLKSSSLFTSQYLISVYCTPVVIVSVSPLTCSFQSDRSLATQEQEEYRKWIDCKNAQR